MKRITLTQGKEALVSDCDYKYLMKWKWYYSVSGQAVRNDYADGSVPKTIIMHRVIMKRAGRLPELVWERSKNNAVSI